MAAVPSKRRTKKLRELQGVLEEIANKPALAEVFDRLHRVLADDGFEEAYSAALAAENLRASYGNAALRAFARDARRAMYPLFASARVARTFPPGLVREIRARKTMYGRPLGFDHLTQLARVRHDGERDALLERAIDEGLTVEELRVEVDEAIAHLWWKNATTAEGMARLGRWQRLLDRRLPDLLAAAELPGPEGDEAREALHRVYASVSKIARALKDALERTPTDEKPN